MVQHPVGYATEDDGLNGPLPPAADDDQVGLDLVRYPDDLVGRRTAADYGLQGVMSRSSSATRSTASCAARWNE